MDILEYFTDPVLRAPTLGSMLMGLAAGLIGVVAYLRKESLVGETLSHAAFPGAIIGILISGFFDFSEESSTFFMLAGACLTGIATIYLIHWLETKVRVPSDAALCFTLAATFGAGITLASHVQFTQTALYRRTLALLYGQAATMTDFHVLLYGGLALLIIAALTVFSKEIQLVAFDRTYATTLGLPVRFIEALFFFLVVLTVVVGIRTVGIVLMSAMLIAPAVAARQFSHHLTRVFALSGLFGLCAGFAGNYFSLSLTNALAAAYPSAKLAIPTGPAIVLSIAAFCLFALIFAPGRGLLSRAGRILFFRYRCLCENILKFLWKLSPEAGNTVSNLSRFLNAASFMIHIALYDLTRHGWIEYSSKGIWRLTDGGKIRAAKIVRLHRLWEVYLADYLGMGAERVHCNAEEMEHIITPDLEEALTKLLKDPKVDPHQQPIPSGKLL